MKYTLIILTFLLCTAFKPGKSTLYIVGCGNDFMGRIDYATAQVEWRVDTKWPEDCNDVEITKQGILYAYRGGARLVDPKDGRQVWNYTAPEGHELYTATRHKRGYLLAMCGPTSKIVTLDKNGKETGQLLLNTGIDDIHGQLRQILPTNHDTYLIPLMSRGEVIEIDLKGTILKRIKVGGTPFSVHHTNQRGQYMVSLGDASAIVILDLESEKVVRRISNDNLIGGVKLLFVAEVRMLPNGNIMVANWNGHVSNKTEPKIVEISPDNRVVSQLPMNAEIKNISAFDIMR